MVQEMACGYCMHSIFCPENGAREGMIRAMSQFVVNEDRVDLMLCELVADRTVFTPSVRGHEHRSVVLAPSAVHIIAAGTSRCARAPNRCRVESQDRKRLRNGGRQALIKQEGKQR